MKHWMLEKNVDEKYFFVMEKFDCKKKTMPFLSVKNNFRETYFPQKNQKFSRIFHETNQKVYYKNGLFFRRKKFIFEVKSLDFVMKFS